MIRFRPATLLLATLLWLLASLSATGAQLPAETAWGSPGADEPGARPFASPFGAATLWLTPGPQAALWLAGGAGGAPQLLLHDELTHFSAPQWSPDGRRAAVLAIPAGTETAALGRWWVVDLDAGAVVPAEQPPAWLPPSAPQAASSGSAAPRLPPASIRVAHHPLNSCRTLADWAVTVIPFEEYVARVLPAEVYTSWPAATLQAQAIAVRTFAWRKVLLAAPGAAYDISDWATDQVLCDNRYARTDAAAAATAGRYLSYAGEVILAQYSAENGHPTLDGGLPYLQAVLDPVGLGQARRGHGHGLSQWGAYRWAFSYGWNATQILAHYYRGAQVVDPLGGDPSLALLAAPRGPSTWLTGSTAYLSAHGAFSSTIPVTVTFSAPGWSAADGDGAAGWRAAWPLPATLMGPVTLTVSAPVVEAVGSSQAAQRITHTVVLSGADRQPPTGQLTVPLTSAALTVTLGLTAADAGGSGVAGVALSGDWQIAAADLRREAGGGQLLPDPAALSGAVLRLPTGQASRWSAVLTPTLPTGRIYRAYARLRATPGIETPAGQSDRGAPSAVDSALANDLNIFRIELFDPATAALLGFADLRAGDWAQSGAYAEFALDFWLAPGTSGRVALRASGTGAAEVAFDRLRILFYPQPFAPTLAYPLARRAGPQTVVAKVLDGAGNPSADLVGVTELTDVTPPGDWRLLAPTGWVTTTARPTITVTVADDLTGVDLASAAARFSSDAGLAWSAWQPAAGAQGEGAAQLACPWPGGEGGTANRVQFRVADQAGWSAVSPAWPVRVDVTPPATTLAARLVARPGLPFVVAWSGDDLNGIAAYDVQTAGASATWQDWLVETILTTATFSAPLTGTLSLRARARDMPGNLGFWSAPLTVTLASGVHLLPMILR